MSVVVIEDIHDTSVLLTLTVYDDTFQVYQPIINIVMKHHQGEEVIGGTTEVRVQNHLDGLHPLLLVLTVGMLALAVSMLCLHADDGTQAQDDG